MNLSTAFVPKIFLSKPFKKGIALDIFPLDRCDPDKFDEDRAKIYDHIISRDVSKEFTRLTEYFYSNNIVRI